MTRPDATTPLTEWVAAHTGWPLAFGLLLLALAVAAFLLWRAWVRTGQRLDRAMSEDEYHARANWGEVAVHHDEADAPALPTIPIDDATAAAWIARAKAMEAQAAEATVAQAEAYLADRPYNVEEDGL